MADLRCFVPEETDRIPRPYRSDTRPKKNFLRHTGLMRERRMLSGDVEGEQYYCDAYRAIRLPTGGTAAADGRTLIHCVYRRLFYSGAPIARLDIGFFVRARDAAAPIAAVPVVQRILETRVKVPLANQQHELRRSGNSIAYHVLAATTRRRRMLASRPPPRWWCRAGYPAAFVEHKPGEIAVNASAKTIPVGWRDVVLRYETLAFGDGDIVPVFFVERPTGDTRAGTLLRRHLVRVQAHREAVRAVLYAIDRKLITITRGTKESDDLQEFLSEAQRIIMSGDRNVPIDRTALLDSYSFELLFSAEPRDRQAILTDLKSIRGNIARRIAELAQDSHMTSVTVNIGGNVESNTTNTTLNNSQLGVLNTGSGTVNATISESFNKGQRSGAPDDVKSALKSLNDQVQALIAKLPPDQAQDVADDYKDLTDEALKDKPRKTRLQAFGDGIIEAAKTVGELASPVAGAVHAVLAVLPLL